MIPAPIAFSSRGTSRASSKAAKGPPMDTDKCAALLRSIDLGSLAAAAEELGYTPSGISRMVASLEKEWGFPLLIRSKSGVRPTADCERMLPALRNLAAAARVCGEQAAAVRGLETGSIVVGSAYRQYYNVLAGVIADFIAEHPNIQVSVLHANSSTLKQMLDDRRIDLAIMSKRGDPARWTPLINDPMMAVLPRTHELAGAKSYPVGRFAEDPFVEVYPDEESDNTLALAESGISLYPLLRLRRPGSVRAGGSGAGRHHNQRRLPPLRRHGCRVATAQPALLRGNRHRRSRRPSHLSRFGRLRSLRPPPPRQREGVRAPHHGKR